MNKKKKYCPMCASWLNYPGSSTPIKVTAEGQAQCQGCDWVDYENPIPVAAVLLSTVGDAERKIVMVKRGIPPFKGGWCLPCGYMNKHEIPKVAAVREAKEETGLDIRLEKILCVCNPMPGEINQITVSYLGRVIGGELKHGDDAEDVQFFTKENCPEPCFRSHKMLVDKWWEGRLGELTGVDLD